MKQSLILSAVLFVAASHAPNHASAFGGFAAGFSEQQARHAELKLYGTDTGRYSTPKRERYGVETYQLQIDGRTYVCIKNSWETYSSTNCH